MPLVSVLVPVTRIVSPVILHKGEERTGSRYDLLIGVGELIDELIFVRPLSE